jgi:hypothetical protein
MVADPAAPDEAASQVVTHHIVAAHGLAHHFVAAAHVVAAKFQAGAGEAPPIRRVAAVKGVARRGLFGAYRVLTTKATIVAANTATVTTKATNVAANPSNVAANPSNVASKPASAVSCCQRGWSERQAQSDSRHRHDITQPLHVYFAFELGDHPIHAR